MKAKEFIAMLSTADPDSEIVIRGEETCSLAYNFEIISADEFFGGKIYADELANELGTKEVFVLYYRYPGDDKK